jgi:hypothetical protein
MLFGPVGLLCCKNGRERVGEHTGKVTYIKTTNYCKDLHSFQSRATNKFVSLASPFWRHDSPPPTSHMTHVLASQGFHPPVRSLKKPLGSTISLTFLANALLSGLNLPK